MAYISCLRVNGVPSEHSYTTPYKSGGSQEISDEIWPETAMVHEAFVAEGDFGEFNTLVACVIERDTLIASDKKVKTIVLRFYQIENGKIETSNFVNDIDLLSYDPHDMHLVFNDGSESIKGNIGIQEFVGTITFSDDKNLEFVAKSVAAGGCRECQGSGFISGEVDPQCGGTGFIADFNGLIL